MEEIYLIDFDDSFTLNIYIELLKLFSKNRIRIVKKNESSCQLEKLLKRDEKIIIILGPGPGHPREYQEILRTLPKLLKRNNIFVMGICLGHQLIWSSMGAKIQLCKNPKHGQMETFNLDHFFSSLFQEQKKITVQRYNSLAVHISKDKILQKYNLFFSADEELLMSYSSKLISYQFHPESVGTTCPRLFFGPLVKFLL